MASVRHVVNTALRRLGRLGAGREPRVADTAECLSTLEGLYSNWVASGAFGRLREVTPRATEYVAYGCERILRRDGAELSVTLPLVVPDGAVCDYGFPVIRGYAGTQITVTQTGETVVVNVEPAEHVDGRRPRDGTPVVIHDEATGLQQAWLFDGASARWQGIDRLQLDQEAPRSTADPEGLAACLAVEVSDTFGAEVGPATVRAAQRYTQAMTHRYGFRSETVAGVYC